MHLADDLYLLSHHDTTGAPLLDHRLLSLGLGSALLAELVMSEHLIVTGSRLTRAYGVGTPVDALGHMVLADIAADPHTIDLDTWVQFLARTAVDRLRERLERAQILHLVEVRRHILVKANAYQPVDPTVPVWRLRQLRAALAAPSTLTDADVALAGLLDAVGLGSVIFADGHRRLRRTVATVVPRLPPPLRQLVAHTEYAIAHAAMNPR